MSTATLTRDWRWSAACAQVDAELFFPPTTRTVEGQLQAVIALGVCGRCPVQPECLTAAPTTTGTSAAGRSSADAGSTNAAGPTCDRR